MTFVNLSSVQLLSYVWLSVTPWTVACQASLSFTTSQSLNKFMSTEFWYYPTISSSVALLLLLSIFPSIRVFSSELAFHIGGQSTGASALASVLPTNIQNWFPLGLTGSPPWCPMDSQESFSPAPQFKSINFFGIQSSLWSNSHIPVCLLEKSQLWLYGSLSAKWCLCFLIWCLGLS